MVVLADLNSTVTFKKSVHIDRLKLAYIRQPVPLNYFEATTKVPEAIFRTSATQTVVEKSEQMEVPKVDNDGGYTRPKRVIQKPVRFLSSYKLDKVKCILAPRDGPDGLAYLIHFVGEPAHISIWTSQKAVTELHESTCLSSPVSSDIPYLESPTTSSVSEHQAVAQNVAFQELNMTSASIRKRYVVSLVCVEERKNKSSASYTMIYYYLVMVEYKTLLIVSRNTNTLQSLLMLFANILGDLYGHVSCTLRGHSFLLTAFDMFSKFIYIKPFVNKDAMSVSEVLMVMFTHYGVCDTLISDQGYELIAKVTSELCSFLCVPQQFTPNIEHQCLGACERIHRTLAATLAPYMNDYLNNWDFLVNAIMFSMNNAVNSSTGYSPFEIVLA
ncbi:POL4-like protein [Mya arenaria]|uniref:POL4-like protein n=1 Tax=Mya arenaria TaxID=6604 RepID=A0ABY7EYL9_MYAAR|nr:POL4-like protein [Mya arenaria]